MNLFENYLDYQKRRSVINPLVPELNATSTGPAAGIFNWGF
jgi:hypothetical protein